MNEKSIKIKRKSGNRRRAIILLALLIPIGVAAAIAANVFGNRAVPSPASASAFTSSAAGPDGTAGYGQDGSPASESASQIIADLQARQNRTTNTFLSVLYGSAGSTEGKWSFTNTDTDVTKQAVIYEASVSYQMVGGQRTAVNTPIRKLGETPIVGPGQHSTTVKWFSGLGGQTRTVCAYIYYYNPQTNAQLGIGFAQNLVLEIK